MSCQPLSPHYLQVVLLACVDLIQFNFIHTVVFGVGDRENDLVRCGRAKSAAVLHDDLRGIYGSQGPALWGSNDDSVWLLLCDWRGQLFGRNDCPHDRC